jgi:hypothetical protein
MARAIAPTISAPPLVTGKELASALGLSEAHIFTLKRRHIVQSVQARKNTFHLGPAVRAYVQYKCGQDSEAQADFHRGRASQRMPRRLEARFRDFKRQSERLR